MGMNDIASTSSSRESTNSFSAVMIFIGAEAKSTLCSSIRFAEESATIFIFLIFGGSNLSKLKVRNELYHFVARIVHLLRIHDLSAG